MIVRIWFAERHIVIEGGCKVEFYKFFKFQKGAADTNIVFFGHVMRMERNFYEIESNWLVPGGNSRWVRWFFHEEAL